MEPHGSRLGQVVQLGYRPMRGLREASGVVGCPRPCASHVPESPPRTGEHHGAALDEFVVEHLLTWQTRAKGLRFERPSGDLEKARATLEARQYDLDLFLQNLGAISILGQARWNEQAARYTAAVEQARAELVALASEADAGEMWTRLHERWEEADTDGKRALLAQLVESIDVRPVGGRRGIPASERTTVVRKGTGRRAQREH